MDGFPQVTKDQLDAEQLAFWNALTQGPRGFYTGGPDTKRLPDLYNAWIHFPQFGQMILQLGDTLREPRELTGRLREIIVLVTSARLGATVEFDFHVPFALNEGLSQDLVDAIRAGREPQFEDELDRAVWQANNQLLDTATLAPDIRDRLVKAIGYPGLVQLFAAVMLYTVTAWTTNVARAALAEDFSADPDMLKRFFAGEPVGLAQGTG